MFFITKTIIALAVILGATELSKRNTTLAAILLAMPIVLFISYTFVYIQSKDIQKVASLSHETILFILPVIPFLFLFSWLLKQGVNFYLTMLISALGIALVTYALNYFFKH